MQPKEAAGGIVVGPKGKIILLYLVEKLWGFPKGGVEAGESLLAAARREVKEEAGIADMELVCELGALTRRSLKPGTTEEIDDHGTRRRTFFLFTTKQESLVPQQGEVIEARWVTIDEALALLTHPKDREFLASVRPIIEAAIQ